MNKEIEDKILYEDNHLLIVNKRAGEIVQGDKTGDLPITGVFADYIADRDNKPGKAFIGLTHRLDRPTSGALVLAKTSKGLSRMNKLFRENGMEKTYWAILEGKHLQKDEKEMVNWLRKNPRNNKSTAFQKPEKGAKEAILKWKSLSLYDNYTLVEINLITGRPHQIRAQFSAAGMKVRGDLKYGAKRSMRNGGISLHCRKLSFLHPVKKTQVSVTAPVPENDNLWQLFEKETETGQQ